MTAMIAKAELSDGSNQYTLYLIDKKKPTRKDCFWVIDRVCEPWGFKYKLFNALDIFEYGIGSQQELEDIYEPVDDDPEYAEKEYDFEGLTVPLGS